MKIAFWSNDNERCAVTANLAAISVMSVIRYPYTIITMENRRNTYNLSNAFFGRTKIKLFHEAGTNYYDGGGLEGLIRKIYRGTDEYDTLESYLTDIISQHLYYIPQSRLIHSELFDYEFSQCIHRLLHIIEEFADICYIDTASHHNLSTKTILEESDLIVVNLCQNQSILDDFFLNYSALSSKAIFLISNYAFHKKLNSKQIAIQYDILPEYIIPVPYNEAYQNSFLNGDVIPFIYKNYYCLKENPNYLFMHSLKKASHIIIKKTEEATKHQEKPLCLY